MSGAQKSCTRIGEQREGSDVTTRRLRDGGGRARDAESLQANVRAVGAAHLNRAQCHVEKESFVRIVE